MTAERWAAELTGTVVMDSGAISAVAENRGKAVSLLRALVERGWQVTIPTVVLVECLSGDHRRDARTNQVVKAIDRFSGIDEAGARVAAGLRHRSRNPSVVDALVATHALHVPGPAIVLTTDRTDLERLIGTSRKVRVIGV